MSKRSSKRETGATEEAAPVESTETPPEAAPEAPAPADDGTETASQDTEGPEDAKPMPDPVPPERLPKGHKRPTLEEFVEAGYPAESYERHMREWEHELASKPAETPPEAKPEPPTRKPIPKDWVYCVALKTCLVRGVAEMQGDRFALPRDEAERRSKRGELRVDKNREH